MNLSIITVSISNDTNLYKTFLSIAKQNLSGYEMEWIIVCPEEIDPKQFTLDFKYVKDKKTGVFHAMNLGIKKSKGKAFQDQWLRSVRDEDEFENIRKFILG